MKKHAVFAGALLLFVFICTAGLFAQRCPGQAQRGSGGWGMDTQYQRMWDPSKIETVSGTVEAVQTVAPMRGMHNAAVLMVKTSEGTLPVHLGPQWYIERLDLGIQEGDAVEVTGSMTTFEGKPAMIAGELKKGDQSVVLRDEDGVPAWAGWRR